jgi:hypothetical protein
MSRSPGKNPSYRRHDAHIACHRLDDDGRDLVGILFEERFDRFEIVEDRHQRIGSRSGRDARRIGQAERGHAGTRLHQQHIGMAVVAALELDDLVPFGVRPRQAQGAHGRFGARVNETHHLNVGHEVHHPPGQFDFKRAGRAVRGPFHGRLLDGLDHLRVGMAGDERSPGKDIVDVAVAVHIVEIGPSPRSMKSGCPPTARKARTGESTPPGSSCWACWKSSIDFWMFIRPRD